MKKLIFIFTLLSFSFFANALPNRYASLNLNQEQSQKVQQIVNEYEYDIQKTLSLIHNNAVALNQASKLPTTKENRVAKAQQLSMLSEGSGFLSTRLSLLLSKRDNDVMKILTPQQVEILNNIPQENIVMYGSNNLIPIR